MNLIPVKKKDGSVVKMTMGDFLIYKKTLKTKSVKTKSVGTGRDLSSQPSFAKATADKQGKYSSVPQKSKINKTKNLPVKNTPHDLSTTTPVKDVFVNEAKAKKQKKPIKKVVKKTVPVKPPVRKLTGTDLEKVLQQLDFDISKDLHTRLDMLLKSRMKSVRTDEQVMAYALRQLDKGGLGLDKNQADKLIIAIKSIMGTQPKAMNRRDRKKAMTLALEPRLNTAKDRAKSKSKLATMQNAQPAKLSNPASTRPALPKTPPEPMQRKPILNDVLPPKIVKKSVGPIDEIKQFDLVEFRRLATNPDQAKELLLNKFVNLKDESFMLYTEAKRAWSQSPLYKQYQDIIKESLEKEDAGISEVINTRGDMKSEEFIAIVEVNKML